MKKLTDVLKKPGLVPLANVEELVDLDAFITYWAAEVLIGLHDGYAANQNNCFFYRDSKAGKFFFIPWGPDAAFKDPGFLPATVPKSVKANGYLCYRLWELPEIRERYRREMRRLLEEVWNEEAMLSEWARIRRLGQGSKTAADPKAQERAEASIQFIKGRRQESFIKH